MNNQELLERFSETEPTNISNVFGYAELKILRDEFGIETKDNKSETIVNALIEHRASESDVMTLEDIKQKDEAPAEEVDYKAKFEELEKQVKSGSVVSEEEKKHKKRFEFLKKEFQNVKDGGRRRYSGWCIWDRVEIEVIRTQKGREIEVKEGGIVRVLKYNGTSPKQHVDEINTQMLNTKQKLVIKYTQE
jgi:hypothetical protein